MRSFSQDRLGTNIGKALKNGYRFLMTRWSGVLGTSTTMICGAVGSLCFPAPAPVRADESLKKDRLEVCFAKTSSERCYPDRRR